MLPEAVYRLLNLCHEKDRHFPVTTLYNENWMLWLILEWHDRHRHVPSPLQFSPTSTWFCEGSPPSVFKARSKREDASAEGHTAVDGVIGNVKIRSGTKAGIEIDTKHGSVDQLIFIEGKMFSRLRGGTDKSKDFDQAARNVACLAATLAGADIRPEQVGSLGFLVVAPKEQIEGKKFEKEMNIESVKSKVVARIQQHAVSDKSNNETERLKLWSENWFEPTLRQLEQPSQKARHESQFKRFDCVAWEALLQIICDAASPEYEPLNTFYQRCLQFNRH